MDAIPTIVETLYNVHTAWKSKGVHIRFLVDLLLDIDDGRVLDSASRRLIVDGAAQFAQVRPNHMTVLNLTSATAGVVSCYERIRRSAVYFTGSSGPIASYDS